MKEMEHRMIVFFRKLVNPALAVEIATVIPKNILK